MGHVFFLQIGHNTAMSIARRSRELIRLDLSWCRNMTDEDLGFIVDNCLSLRVLKLFGCTQVLLVLQIVDVLDQYFYRFLLALLKHDIHIKFKFYMLELEVLGSNHFLANLNI